MNKKLLSYGVSICLAIALIVLLQPYLKQLEEKQQYDFTVQSVDGELKKDDFKGQVLAIYFGYMYCPDVCPTSLSSLSQALKSFEDEKLKAFKGLFISVDPKRDTPKLLKEYAQYFHPNFLGATSSKENIDQITSNYGSYYQMIKLDNSAMDYSVSHTSYIYLFDKEGNLASKIDHFANPEEIEKALRSVL